MYTKLLLWVARRGDVEDIRSAVEMGADVNAKDRSGCTALAQAAAGGLIDVVRFLVRECEADVNASNNWGATALAGAAAYGHLDVVRYLAANDEVDVNMANNWGDTALMEAAANGHVNVVQCLAGECGAAVDVANEWGTTALLVAARYGHFDVVRYLVGKCRADVNATDADGDTALTKAARRGYRGILRYLSGEYEHHLEDMTTSDNKSGSRVRVDVSARIHRVQSNFGLSAAFERAHTGRCLVDRRHTAALIRAAEEGYFDLVQNLVGKYGADANATDCSGSTAVMMAAKGGHMAIVRYLVGECAGNVDIADRDGSTALIKAAGLGHLGVVRYLVGQCGASVNAADRDGSTALIKAAGRGHVAVVRYLAGERDADVNATDGDNATALMKAACRGYFDVAWYLAGGCSAAIEATDPRCAKVLAEAAGKGLVKFARYLVDSGVDAHFSDCCGATVLMRAAAEGRVEVVRYLAMECGVDANATDRHGTTALMRAAARSPTGTRDFAVVRCLAQECKADVNASDEWGTTALMHAVDIGEPGLVRVLVTECGADVNVTDANGATALMQAAAKRDVSMVQYLAAEFGADLNVTDSSGVTALMKAALEGHVDVVRCLGECGANVNDSALRIAREQNDQEMQRILTQVLKVNHADGNEAEHSVSTVPSWSISPSEIELLSFVDTGNVGGEYRARWLDADVAVKLFLPGSTSNAVFEEEFRLWHQLRHPNVIMLYGACDACPLPLQLFVCEYASHGSLHDYVKVAPPTQHKVWSFLLQAALGLEYLHGRGLVHGDLRCSNILIGSDGLAKLSNFGRRELTQTLRLRVASLRWQAPEVLEGSPPSFASDIYSLGMCILEALTREVPWKNWRIEDLRTVKRRWDPSASGTESWEPLRPPSNAAYTLVCRMCCQDPAKRASIAFIVHTLERFAVEQSSDSSLHCEFPNTFDASNYPQRRELWSDLRIRMEECDSDLYRQAFNELTDLRMRLRSRTSPPRVLERFHGLVRDFYYTITVPSDQAWVLQLSATRATATSITSFCRSLRSLWAAQGETDDAARAREERWTKYRSKHIEIFISEASKTYALLEELRSEEDQIIFLNTLKSELEHPSFEYSPTQLEVLKAAYEDITSNLDSDSLPKMTPEWFIPWDELVIDTSRDPLGCGGYGSVYRAKWLDSDVVVKRLANCNDKCATFSSWSYDSLLRSSTSSTPAHATRRAEAMATFLREVNIWFGFSHPHVIRLFGACHVGRPFFVCEYATNGTLVSYLRKHPNELWSKLHEAALGVQYLHARGVVHGDLKGNNIVIGSDKKTKVTDFGLSSFVDDDCHSEISAASHWVAPECLVNEDSRPTFASDIYSLGMCIVEALRVVEPGEDSFRVCLPWGAVDNIAVKNQVRRGKLPSQPWNCTDEQWQLVRRMCAFESKERIKVATVVDSLARFANASDTTSPPQTAVSPGSISEVVVAARELLKRLHNGVTNQYGEVYPLYESLWNGLEEIHSRIDRRQFTTAGLVDFCELVGDAETSTRKLQRMTDSLVSLAESALTCYALRRRLNKFVEAHNLPLSQIRKQVEQQ